MSYDPLCLKEVIDVTDLEYIIDFNPWIIRWKIHANIYKTGYELWGQRRDGLWQYFGKWGRDNRAAIQLQAWDTVRELRTERIREARTSLLPKRRLTQNRRPNRRSVAAG